MSLAYRGVGGAGQTIAAFNFDAWMSEHKDGLGSFYEWSESDTKAYLSKIMERLSGVMSDKNYAAIRFSNPVMKKLIGYDWDTLTPRVQVMTEPSDAYVMLILYREDINPDDPIVPASN